MILNMNERYRQGIAEGSHPLTREIFEAMEKADQLYNDGMLYNDFLRSGGDGDVGQSLLYLLDITMEMLEQEEGND